MMHGRLSRRAGRSEWAGSLLDFFIEECGGEGDTVPCNIGFTPTLFDSLVLAA